MMLSSELCRWLSLCDRLGRAATDSVSDREKPIAAPKDWGMFMEEPDCAWSFDKLDLEQSIERGKTVRGTFYWLSVEVIKKKTHTPYKILSNVVICTMKSIDQSLSKQWRTNPQQVSNKQALTKWVILLLLLCMRSKQVFRKCLKWSPSAGFHNVSNKVQRRSLLFNETKIHSNCKVCFHSTQSNSLQNGHWWQLAMYHQIQPIL